MRVIHIIHNLDRAGAQKSLASLLRGLSRQDGEHLVFAWKRTGPVARDIDLTGVEIVEGPGRFLKAVGQLNRLIRTFHADLLHAHMEDAASLAALAQLRTRRPYVVTFHDGTKLVPDLPPIKKIIRKQALAWSAGRASTVIGVRGELKPLIVSGLGVPAERLKTLPACVEIPNSYDVKAAAAARATAQGPLRILAVARHVPLKRHDILIDAVAELGRRGIPCEATILGDGPLLADNRERAKAVIPPAHIHLPGASDQVADHLKEAHIFVNSSEYEGTSMSILEAMSWRIPVIASDVPGNRELVRLGKTGYSFPLSSPSALAGRIIEATSTDNSTIVETAAQTVEDQFSADALAWQHLTLYHTLCNSRGAAEPHG